jgi:ferritin-like metal-binding protein YciE
MAGDRIAQALARIEAAAGRIEAAAPSLASVAGDPELADKYETLRRETGAALADLDRLIGSLGE